MANSSLLSGLIRNSDGTSTGTGTINYNQIGDYQQGNLVPSTITTTPYIGGQANQIISTLGNYNDLQTYNYKQPKNGDIKMDADSFNFYVFIDEYGWVPCEIESTKKERDGKGDVKESKVILTHDMSIFQMKEEKKRRVVLFEKVNKPKKYDFLNGGCITTTGTSTITINPYINWQINQDNQITYTHDYVFNDNIYNQTNQLIGISSRGYGTAAGTITNGYHSTGNISNYNSC